jgi:hypothetical protein
LSARGLHVKLLCPGSKPVQPALKTTTVCAPVHSASRPLSPLWSKTLSEYWSKNDQNIHKLGGAFTFLRGSPRRARLVAASPRIETHRTLQRPALRTRHKMTGQSDSHDYFRHAQKHAVPKPKAPPAAALRSRRSSAASSFDRRRSPWPWLCPGPRVAKVRAKVGCFYAVAYTRKTAVRLDCARRAQSPPKRFPRTPCRYQRAGPAPRQRFQEARPK